jgi:hypothetical protein
MVLSVVVCVVQDSLCGEDIANKDLLDILRLETGTLNSGWEGQHNCSKKS